MAQLTILSIEVISEHISQTPSRCQPIIWANYSDQPVGWSPQMVGIARESRPNIPIYNSGLGTIVICSDVRGVPIISTTFLLLLLLLLLFAPPRTSIAVNFTSDHVVSILPRDFVVRSSQIPWVLPPKTRKMTCFPFLSYGC